jgi:hypothetical protein
LSWMGRWVGSCMGGWKGGWVGNCFDDRLNIKILQLYFLSLSWPPLTIWDETRFTLHRTSGNFLEQRRMAWGVQGCKRRSPPALQVATPETARV